MIKKNIKWYILGIIIFLNVIIIPITFSKYATTLSKTLKLNIVANEKIAYFKEYAASQYPFTNKTTGLRQADSALLLCGQHLYVLVLLGP